MVAASVTAHQVASNNGGGNQDPHPINDGTDPAPVGSLQDMSASVLDSHYAVQTNYVFENHKNSVSDAELYLLLSNLQKSCNLN